MTFDSRHQEMIGLARRALQHLEANTTDMAPDTVRQPVAAYIDRDRYQAERQRIFKQLPLALALSLELPNPGDYKAMTVLDTPIIITRNDDGEVRCFINACRHRGARLCDDGTATCRVFACPYHAWTYDRDGALVGRYAADTFGEIDPAEHSLTTLPCDERSGLIWVTLDRTANVDIDEWLGDFAAELDTLALSKWHLHETRALDGPGWKVTMDGYLEAYHHNLVHGQTVGQHTVGNLLVLDTYGPHQRLTFGRKSLNELGSEDVSDWAPLQHIRLIHSCFPNLSISGILGDHCLVSQIFPGPEPDRTQTIQFILSAKPPANDEALQATEHFSAMVLQAVRDEDYAIGFGIQQSIEAGGNEYFVYGRNEPAVQNYHSWIDHFMSDQRRQEYTNMAQKTDTEYAAELNRRGHLAFNWNDLDKLKLPTGVETQLYRVGDPADESAPTVFKVYYPPECFVEAHTHACDYTEIILEGSQKVGAEWHHAGDIRVGLANRGYGPLVAGPEGATVLFMFKDSRWPAITIGNNDGSTLGSDVIEQHLERVNSD